MEESRKDQENEVELSKPKGRKIFTQGLVAEERIDSVTKIKKRQSDEQLKLDDYQY